MTDPVPTDPGDFMAFGHYYQLVVRGFGVLECRSVLEIVRSDLVPANPTALLEQVPDATIVMMNPGSSVPLASSVIRPVVQAHRISELEVALVTAKPDNTQFQVMRVMDEELWGHARVLNLSDIREPKSTVFYRTYRAVEGCRYGSAHSIFSTDRLAELFARLGPHSTPVICAWGVSRQLDLLISRCVIELAGRPRFGWKKPGADDRCYHPLPPSTTRQELWLQTVLAELHGRTVQPINLAAGHLLGRC